MGQSPESIVLGQRVDPIGNIMLDCYKQRNILNCKVEKDKEIFDVSCGLVDLFGFLGKGLLLAVCTEI